MLNLRLRRAGLAAIRCAGLAVSALILGIGSSAQEPATPTGSMLAGLRFRTVGPANMSGRIVDVAVVESNTSTFYAASATGGLWKTTDNGTTFTPVFQAKPLPPIRPSTL